MRVCYLPLNLAALLCMLALCALGAVGAAQAQSTHWPTKPIRMVVTGVPDGTSSANCADSRRLCVATARDATSGTRRCGHR